MGMLTSLVTFLVFGKRTYGHPATTFRKKGMIETLLNQEQEEESIESKNFWNSYQEANLYSEKELEASRKNFLWFDIKAHFRLENDDVKKRTLVSCGTKWKAFKTKLRVKFMLKKVSPLQKWTFIEPNVQATKELAQGSNKSKARVDPLILVLGPKHGGRTRRVGCDIGYKKGIEGYVRKKRTYEQQKDIEEIRNEVPWSNEHLLENKELNAIIGAWFTLCPSLSPIMYLGIAIRLEIFDRQLPFEYIIANRSTDVMVMAPLVQNINHSAFRSMFEREKLVGLNFNDWFCTLKMVLRVEKKLSIIEQPIPPAPPVDFAT
nr:zinc finger, CCHC-type [Tanacetum cinerariifolium]